MKVFCRPRNMNLMGASNMSNMKLKWSIGEINNAISRDGLTQKINEINYNELVTTTETMLHEVVDDPAVEVRNISDVFCFLNECRGYEASDFLYNGFNVDNHATLNADGFESGSYDYQILIYVLKLLTTSIILSHLSELTRIQGNLRRDDHPIDKVVMDLPMSSQDPDIPGIELHVNGHCAKTSTSSPQIITLEDLINSLVPEYDSKRWVPDKIPGLRADNLLYGKMILELLTLNDYGLESVRDYAITQHDWVMSFLFMLCGYDNMLILNPSSGSTEAWKSDLVRGFMTTFLYGCDLPSASDGDPRELTSILGDPGVIGGRSTLHSRTYQFGLSLLKSCALRSSELYDRDFIEYAMFGDSMPFTESVVSRTYPYRDMKRASRSNHSNGGAAVSFPRNSDPWGRGAHTIGSNHNWLSPELLNLPVDGAMPCYHRALHGIAYNGSLWVDVRKELSSMKSGTIGFIKSHVTPNDVEYGILTKAPSEIRRKITKDHIIELEDRTKFIHRHLLSSNFSNDVMVQYLYMLQGDREGSIPIEELTEFISDNPVVLHDYFNSSDILGSFFLNPFRTSFPSLLMTGNCADRDWLGLADWSSASIREEVRLMAFAKCYKTHQLVRLHEYIPEDEMGVEVSALDLLVVSDVLDSMRRSFVDEVLQLDTDSEAFKGFADDCLELCGASRTPVEVETLPLGYDDGRLDPRDVDVLYGKMLEDPRVDEIMEELDDALIGIVVDRYVGYELGVGSNPAGFVLEELRMSAGDRYEEILRNRS